MIVNSFQLYHVYIELMAAENLAQYTRHNHHLILVSSNYW